MLSEVIQRRTRKEKWTRRLKGSDVFSSHIFIVSWFDRRKVQKVGTCVRDSLLINL